MTTMEELEFREGFAGGCYVNGTMTCVAQPEDFCDDGTFVTAHYLRANKGHPLRYCAGELENVLIGRCGDSGECSNLALRCEDNSTFVEQDENCTVTQDLSREALALNTYGKCGDRCVWSPEDCLEGEDYIPHDFECTADKVQIGACFAGHAFCAVGPESCIQRFQEDEPFWTHQEVVDKVGANCFLSSLPRPPTTAPPTRAPWTRTPTVSPVEGGASDPFEPPQNNDGSTTPRPQQDNGVQGSPFGLGSGMLNTGGLVAIVAIVAVLLGIVIGVSTVFCKRKDEQWRVDKEPTLPPTEIAETSFQVEYAESTITDI